MTPTPERGAGPDQGGDAGSRDLDLVIARLLRVGSYLSIGLLGIGILLMAAHGRSPLDLPAHGFDPRAIVGDLEAGRPEGALWLGLVVLLVTPAARVGASLAGYLRTGERHMAIVSAAILSVIAAGVVIGVAIGGPAA